MSLLILRVGFTWFCFGVSATVNLLLYWLSFVLHFSVGVSATSHLLLLSVKQPERFV
jgi:hypothetical protein